MSTITSDPLQKKLVFEKNARGGVRIKNVGRV